MEASTAVNGTAIYQLLFESSQDPMWMILEDHFVVANQSAASVLGYESIEKLLNTHPSQLSPAEQADGQSSFDKANQMMKIAMQEGYHRFEWLHKKRNGEVFPVEVTLTRVPYQHKTGLFCVWRDITEQKLTQQQLEEAKVLLEHKVSERTATLADEIEQRKQAQIRLQEAQRIAHLGHWELDFTSNVLTWSEEIYRLFEVDPSQFGASYEAFLDLIHPDDRELVNLSFTDSLRTKQPYDLVHRLLMKDGRIKYVRERCNTEFNQQGEPILAIGTVQDITEKETLRLTLVEEEERYHSLVNNIPAIVYRCVLDKNWTMQYMSSFTEDLTGYPVTDFLYNRVRTYASVIHPDDINHVEKSVYDGVHGDGRYFIEYRIIDKHGMMHWVFEKGQVVHNQIGQIDFLDGFIMDISERKQVEEQLHDKKELIQAIHDLQSRFISQPDPFHICRELLEDIKNLTGSQYGLISEVYRTPEDKPYMVAYAIDKLAWNRETRKLYQEAQQKGFEFHKLDNLFGHVITHKTVVISNDPTHDQRSVGLPKGHPPINNFLGIPVFYGEKLVGMVGLANRKQGYDQEILDYITPLVSAYGQIIVARQAQQARDAAEATLAKLARLDGLLGIPNRRSFDEYIEKQWKQARRGNEALSVLMIDIDHFKLYNDHYGHQQGDDCLIEVAEQINQCLKRPADLLARYGGEEFVCVLPGTPEQGALTLAEAIRNQVINKAIVHNTSPVTDHITLSIGVATTIPAPHHSPKELIAKADQALYRAKSEGRNRSIVAD